jgi:hypothetical protein
MARNTRNPEKEALWRSIIAELNRSGLSQREFCKRGGHNVNTLSYWLFEIKKRDSEIEKAARKKEKLTASEQRAVVERWRKSGLSQKKFCRKEEVSEWQLSAWKQKYPLEEDVRENVDSIPPEFVEVNTAGTGNATRSGNKSETQPQPKVIAKIRFGAGTVISVYGDADHAAVKAIVTALMEFEHAFSR